MPEDGVMPANPRAVAILVHDGVQGLDVVGPLDVFDAAARLHVANGGPRPYSVTVVSADGGPVRAASGLRIGVDGPLSEAARIDTLVVAGGPGIARVVTNELLLAEVTNAVGRARRVTSVCTGAFVLAALGVLDGRRVTTHWAAADALAAGFPKVNVDSDPIFVRDGHVWTSAGVTAGMDLALALVADDLGADLAHDVARWLVLFARRPGGQSQFSATLAARPPQRRELSELIGWISDHPDAELTVTALADRIGLSPRHLARIFVEDCGVTPAEHVAAVRIERARSLLETTDLTIDAVADQVGVSPAALHRMFRRCLDTTPSTYRAHFAEPSLSTPA